MAFIAPQALLMRLPLVGPLAFIPMQARSHMQRWK